jgi:hypothetical protein
MLMFRLKVAWSTAVQRMDCKFPPNVVDVYLLCARRKAMLSVLRVLTHLHIIDRQPAKTSSKGIATFWRANI